MSEQKFLLPKTRFRAENPSEANAGNGEVLYAVKLN